MELLLLARLSDSSLQFPYSVPFAIWVWQNLDSQFRHTCQAFPAIWNGTCQVIAINPPAITNSKKVSSTELGKFFAACHSPVLTMHSKVVRYKESNHSLNFFRRTACTLHNKLYCTCLSLHQNVFLLISSTQLYSSSGMWNAVLCFALVQLDLPSMWHFWCSYFKQFFPGFNNWTCAFVWKPNHVYIGTRDVLREENPLSHHKPCKKKNMIQSIKI